MGTRTLLEAKKDPARAAASARPRLSQRLDGGPALGALGPGYGHDFGSVRPGPALETCPLASPRRCPFGGACHTCPVQLQAKLAVGQPDDAFEREADRAAEQAASAPEPSFAPVQVSPLRPRGATLLQRWNADIHERITTLAGDRVLSDPLFVWQVSQHSALMDVTTERLLWTGPRFLLGIEKGEGPEHGEDGNYSNPSESAARAQNVREQNARRDLAVRHHREFEALHRRGEPVHRMGTVAERSFHALGDACHIAQDRGSHGEGVRGRGHNDPRTGRGWNPDDVGDNGAGYAQAVSNTVSLFEEWQRLTAGGAAGGVLRRRAASRDAPAVAPPIVHEVLRSPGQPLDAATRNSMESRFGHDFSQVRVHTGLRAADSARAVNAQAYTVGRGIVFGAGQYAPATAAGKRLLAHELTHVIQQRGTPAPGTSLPLSTGREPAEQEAGATASQVLDNGPALPIGACPGARLQRTIKVDKPDKLIPNLGGKGLVQTNAQTVGSYLNALCSSGSVAVDGTSGAVSMSTAFCAPPAWPPDVAGPSTPSPVELSGTPTGCGCICYLVASEQPWTIQVNDYTWPHTEFKDDRAARCKKPGGSGGAIFVPSPNSLKEWGAAEAGKEPGKEAVAMEPYMILGHELCGHAWLGTMGLHCLDESERRGEGGHQAAVARENELRKEHGIDLRGTFKEPYCGESFWRLKKEGAPVNWSVYRWVCGQWRRKKHGTRYKITDTIPWNVGEGAPEA